MVRSKVLCFLFIWFSALSYSCNQTKYPFGKRLFLSHCADCHMDDGKGFAKLYPSLQSESMLAKSHEFPCIIRNGIIDSTSLIKMLPMPQLSEVEITNIINYIMQDLNGSKKEIYKRDVERLLSICDSE